jgi:hypothetical protein
MGGIEESDPHNTSLHYSLKHITLQRCPLHLATLP